MRPHRNWRNSLGAPIKRTVEEDHLMDDSFLNNHQEEFRQKSEEFENMLNTSKQDVGFNIINKLARTECNLSSVLVLRKNVEDNCHKALRELFAQHVFVGSINIKQSLIQHNTKLYLCNTRKIMNELFYQFVLYNFQNFHSIQFYEPLPIYDLAKIALDLPSSGWTSEDGDKDELAQKVSDILLARKDMLMEYFSMVIDDGGNLKSIPLLLDNHTPEMAGLPIYILRLATEVDWEQEQECFDTFAKETALYYSQLHEENVMENKTWKWMTEHVFYPAMKDYFIPSKLFTENTAILQIADLPNLYKVFERC